MMRGYEHVAFSKGTAKVNPEMIIDAYNKIIVQLRSKIKDLSKSNHVVKVGLYSSSIDTLISRREYASRRDHYEGVDLKVSPKEIISIYNQIQIQYKAELAAEKQMEEVAAELIKFRREFT